MTEGGLTLSSLVPVAFYNGTKWDACDGRGAPVLSRGSPIPRACYVPPPKKKADFDEKTETKTSARRAMWPYMYIIKIVYYKKRREVLPSS